ncbi:MAG: hypothetical protein F4020_07455, partial [Gammaproteobacteria bacterium]|nr:hypothetical protein [Gammaproteobacteria bacterium]
MKTQSESFSSFIFFSIIIALTIAMVEAAFDTSMFLWSVPSLAGARSFGNRAKPHSFQIIWFQPIADHVAFMEAGDLLADVGDNTLSIGIGYVG